MDSYPRSFGVDGVGGVRIVADRRGDPGARPVVFLHGGGQTRRSWGGAAEAVAARGWQAITVDLRGHGESDWAADGDYRVTSFARDVLEVLAALPPRPVLVGASLGGFTSMLLAGEIAPRTVSALVLVDIVPNMDVTGAVRVHGFMNDRLHSGFATLQEAADAIHAYNPHRPPPTDLDGLRANLRERDGRWYWHWDPRFIDGTAAMPPVEIIEVDRMDAAVAAILAQPTPILLVRGQLSDLVTERCAEDFLRRHPQVAVADVGGAGHMVAGDRNDHFAAAVLDFLERCGD